jgi:hypothetical protein
MLSAAQFEWVQLKVTDGPAPRSGHSLTVVKPGIAYMFGECRAAGCPLRAGVGWVVLEAKTCPETILLVVSIPPNSPGRTCSSPI